MNRFRELEREFTAGKIAKHDYISKIFEKHQLLWEYQEFINDKNIAAIEISPESIILRTKQGIKMFCDSQDERLAPIEILNFGDYEHSEIQMIKKFLRKDSVILDIGANIGWYCLNLAGILSRGKILSFEPVEKTFIMLRRNIQLNKFENIKIFNFGFSDKTETLTFFYDPTQSGASSLRNLHGKREKVKVECKVKKLDDFTAKQKLAHIDFIKCDVEGAEKYVVEGGLQTLIKYKPVVFLELLRKWAAKFNYHPNEVIEILKGIGYQCHFAEKSQLIKINKIDEKTAATNFYFLHSVKHRQTIKRLVKP